MARQPRHSRMYKDSPKLERGEDGNMEAKKPSDKRGELPTKAEEIANDVQSGTDGMKVTERHATERTMMKHKHMKEHMDMHSAHEVEHMTHKGDKSEMHARHHEKLKSLHKEHEAEHKSMHSKHEKEINGVEAKDQDVKENKPAEKAEAKGE